MKTRAEAQQLASSMTEVGELMGVQMSHLLSPMDEPLGRAVGNALEVAECVEILQGGGPEDLIALILDLGAKVSNASREQLSELAAMTAAPGGSSCNSSKRRAATRQP